jgi:hypothetical protein
MAKKAICVGINDYPYGEGNDLRGCVNDANDWATLLKTRFGFTDVKLLLDAQATKANILASLSNLVTTAQAGDVLVFTNASHGTYIPEKGGDEPTYDEAICPYDVEDGQLIVDDELRELFVKLPAGVSLTVISDSCHSGSVTREAVETSDQRRNRFLPPAVRGAEALTPTELHRASKKKEKHPESKMKEILLSGCQSNQTSADAFIDGNFHGAMTYHAIKVIAEANYQITYEELHKRLLPMLADEGYDQVPQLEGSAGNKKKQIFS